MYERKKRGTKKNIGTAKLIKDRGLENDAHAGFAHRQVSLLAAESIKKMQDKGVAVGPGDFGENLVTSGLDLVSLPVGTRLRAGKEVRLRVTQIGKECHTRCAIYYQTGDCIMPREGIFAEVLKGGEVSIGDVIAVYPSYRFGVITVSDKGSAGLREDKSGPLIAEMLLPWGDTTEYHVVPDEDDCLSELLIRLADEKELALLFTTGGTGFGPRDITPEATRRVIEREVPGIPEAMRQAGLASAPQAMLSRAVAGIRGKTLIINLPGSPRAVGENLAVFIPVMDHALEILTGRGGECGNMV